MKRKAKPLPMYLTTEEIDRFFRVIEVKGGSKRDVAIFRLAYHRGLRASELGLFQLSDYREKANHIQVHRLKGSNSFEYGITQAEDKAVKAWIRERGNHAGTLFESRNHHPISRTRLDQLMKKYCAAAGIPPEKAHMHALKHSCGTHLSARDPDIFGIKDHMGHVDIKNTMIYIQMTNKHREDFASRQRNWS